MALDVAVVGAGPAGLMAAEVLADGGCTVTVYDRMPSVGRKFLLAGRGGLNLTHAEPLPPFLSRYGGGLAARIADAVDRWPPDAMRRWCADLGQDTFVGTSGRVFPCAMKASPLLRAWRARLDGLGVRFALRHRWTGWTETGALAFETPDGPRPVAPDATLLALGGASWPRLGSDGAWVAPLAAIGVPVAPLAPANCGFDVAWSPVFLARHEGAPLKAVALHFAGRVSRGDLVVTRQGLEGGALYGLSAPLRDAVRSGVGATLEVALRPDMSRDALAGRIARRKPRESLATALKRLVHLAPVAVGLLQEDAHARGEDLSGLSAAVLAERINAVAVRLIGPAPLARAISTAGGVSAGALDDAFMLRGRPGTFVAGEMLDWEAPTGGYLLQACFATGAAAAAGLMRWRDAGAGSAEAHMRDPAQDAEAHQGIGRHGRDGGPA